MTKKRKQHAIRNEGQILKDKCLIAELYINRWSLNKMKGHEELNHLSRTQIHNDLNAVKEYWKEKTVIDLDHEKNKQLRTLDKMIRESVNSFDISQRTESGKRGPGNHNFLGKALDAVKEQNKILGIYAVIKTENVNTNTMEQSLKIMSNDELERELKNLNEMTD